MKPIAVAALIASVAALSAAHAQTVYRCGNAYAQAPCADARPVEVGDARSPAQQAEARRVADAERKLAADMRHDRLVDERMARPAAAASLSGHPPAKVAVIVTERHPKKRAFAKPPPTTDFIAYDPTSRKRRKD